MSIVIFAHDGYIIKYKKNYYSNVYNNEIIKRYSHLGEEVKFLVRLSETEVLQGNPNLLNETNFFVEGIPNFKSVKGLLHIRNIFKQIKNAVKNASVVIVRLPSDIGLIVEFYARKFNKKYLIEVVGCPLDSLKNHSFFGKILSPIYYIFQKKSVLRGNYVVYVTSGFLQKRYPNFKKNIGCSDVKINTHDLSVLQYRINRIETSNIQNLSIGSIGPLDMKYKGFDLIIKALSKLKTKGFNIKYYILGSGNEKWIKSQINKYKVSDSVILIKPIGHSEVFNWFNSIDLYIQPSKTEGLPRALIEAMSMGVPSLGTNVGGIPELLDVDDLLRVNKVTQDFINIITNLNQEKLRKMALRNFEHSKGFSQPILEKKRIDFFQEFLKEK